ncbi:GDA1_CD39 domain-containing protein [Cephalotus follicularis]|uniref:GDA1_CD39 domain-containing protein n=1 Tax=Cephalotus follicularis TaxID=3775 RepID=A0A1Q3ARG6_CEPFO|nr:GDA1_CD39 domain-containing protein [Cephalotus follicularis]
MEPKSPSKIKLSITGFTQYKRLIKFSSIGLLGLLSLVVIHFAFYPGKASSVYRESYYTVVVDCGRTGTRVNVYGWELRNVGNADLPILVQAYPDNSNKSSLWKSPCQYHCMQIEPGLDKFVGNTSGVRASLEQLIVWAEQWVPRERHRDTPIFVLATAGLRKLALKDSRQVLDDVEAVVKEHLFLYKKSWIRVLSGKEEAYYGWVALNYKMGSLGNSSGAPTLGLLDLGGSSLQVVLEVDGARHDEHLIRSKIGSVEHQIIAYTWPAFGLNEALDRTVVMLSQVLPLNTGNRLEVKHPCLSSSFGKNYTCDNCGEQNITDLEILRHQIQKTKISSIFLSGDPNWEQCKGLARAAAMNWSRFDWSQPTTLTNCKASLSSSVGSNILNLMAFTHRIEQFHALSGFFAVYKKLNLSPRANLTKIWEKGQKLCLKSWAAQSSLSGLYCFRVAYMASLIEDALCLGELDITFGPGDVSWTLGAALAEGEYLWISTTRAHTSISTLRNIEFSPVFLFVLLLCLLFIVYCSQIKLPMPGKRGSAAGASLPYVYPKCRPS